MFLFFVFFCFFEGPFYINMIKGYICKPTTVRSAITDGQGFRFQTWWVCLCTSFYRGIHQKSDSRRDVSSLSGACATQTSHHITEDCIRKSKSVLEIMSIYWNVVEMLPLVLIKLLLTDRYTLEVKNSHHQATFYISNHGFKWLNSMEWKLWQEEHEPPLLTCTKRVHSVQVRCIILHKV